MKRPRFLFDLAIFAWPLVIAAAVLDFTFGEFLPAIAPLLGGDRSSAVTIADEIGPFFSKFHLIACGLAFVLFLPSFLRDEKEGRNRTFLRPLVIAGLLFLAFTVLRSLTRTSWLLACQNLLFAATHVGVAVFAALRGRTLPIRAVGTMLLLGLAMPHLWRSGFEIQGGEPSGSQIARFVRQAGDVLIPAATALLLLVPDGKFTPRRLLVAAAFPALLLAVALTFFFSPMRKLLVDVTDLYLTTLPPAATVIILPLALAAIVRIVLRALTRDEDANLAVAMVLLSFTGFLPLQAENQLAAFLATLLLAAWIDGRGSKKADLLGLLR